LSCNFGLLLLKGTPVASITDTIQALGTGIWKARDGQVIARIPSRQQLKDDGLRKKVQAVEKALARLRARLDESVRTGV